MEFISRQALGFGYGLPVIAEVDVLVAGGGDASSVRARAEAEKGCHSLGSD